MSFQGEVFGLIPKYKRYIRNHYQRLLGASGSNQAVVGFLYRLRRNPSAHAAWDALGVSVGTSLADLHNDALLLKCLARLSVQRYYDAVVASGRV